MRATALKLLSGKTPESRLPNPESKKRLTTNLRFRRPRFGMNVNPGRPSGSSPKKRCLCIGFWGVNTIAICIKRFTRLYQALGSADSLAGYVVPCVRFTCVVRLYIAASSTVATLGMSGW
jgi:hypothetical protein